ncbi:uncharacterized protein LOC130676049 [Microplitis mediator]|uniref:uncharacterized protein LOC130676049 n=1 Tax=Microplitis mediator TaxID=375433 RepID=UPI002556BE89|nr:uncharacterized protein LOC130676049 [Microplitis mediator]
MSFYQLPYEMKKKIFSNLGRKELRTIRQIDSNWKIVIDDLRKWKKRCLVDEIKPWKNQLIKLQYPSLKSNKYNDLKDEQWKIIFLLYKKWRQVFNSNHCTIHNFKIPQENIPHELANSNIKFHYDLLANHFVVGINRIGLNCLYAINEKIDLKHKLKFENYADSDIILKDDEINWFNFIDPIEIKIWITGTGKVINIMYFRSQILFWDVMRKTKIPTPSIFFQDMRSLHLRRGTDEYFYVINTFENKLISVIRLDYVENEITTAEILTINFCASEIPEFLDFYAERRKIMIIYTLFGLNKLITTIVQIPQSQSLPIIIDNSFQETNTAITVLNYSYNYKFIIPCMNVVIGHHIDNGREFIVQVSRFDENNNHTTSLKHYVLPQDIMTRDFYITSMALYFNHIFIATAAGKLIIFKLKHLQHLLYLNFDYLKPKIIDTKVSSINGLKITKHNNRIIILLTTLSSQVNFLFCNLHL